MSAAASPSMRWALALLAGLALCGCETTAERSAQLEREARRSAREARAAQSPVSIRRPSRRIAIVATAVLRGSERTAAVVTLRNDSAEVLRAAPIAIDVRDARGVSLYRNDAPGLTPALTSLPLLRAHSRLTWIDDQVLGAAGASSVSARVGEGSAVAGSIPKLRIVEAHAFEDPANGPSEEGIVANESAATQQELVIYAVARRAGRIQAVGRAVLPEAPARSSSRFQIFFTGDPRGAQMQLSAPPTTLR